MGGTSCKMAVTARGNVNHEANAASSSPPGPDTIKASYLAPPALSLLLFGVSATIRALDRPPCQAQRYLHLVQEKERPHGGEPVEYSPSALQWKILSKLFICIS